MQGLQGWQTFSGVGVNGALFDIWSLTHVLTGTIQGYFIGFLGLCMNALLHVAFEVFEQFYPELFRVNNANANYTGDTILNSIGDVIAFTVGFMLWRLLSGLHGLR